MITIIVLLILAGVAIATLTGENGVLTQAENAKGATEKASVIEQVQVDILGEQAKENVSVINAGTLQTILKEYFTEESVPEDANTITGETILIAKEEYGGYEIQLSEIYNGEILESYVGDYADMDNDGEAEGIIYADLAVGRSGQMGDNWGVYSYEAETGLKEYYIREENYTEPKFGNVEGKLIAPIEGTSGKDRFYVMALEDINPGICYCWYDAAYGKLDKIVGNSDNDFGDGKENTKNVMNKWNLGIAEGGWGAQDDNSEYDDMWGAIKEEVSQGWFVPSKSEWIAFEDMASELGVISGNAGNYSDYGLSGWYWSSSQGDTYSAYRAAFNDDSIYNFHVVNLNFVRLSATF